MNSYTIFAILIGSVSSRTGNYELCSSTPMTWPEAENCCLQRGYHLASIHSDSEHDDARTECGGVSSVCWIGLVADIGDPDSWHWVDKTPAIYEGTPITNSGVCSVPPWIGTPGACNTETIEGCSVVQVLDPGTYDPYIWDDRSCTSTYKPLCKVCGAIEEMCNTNNPCCSDLGQLACEYDVAGDIEGTCCIPKNNIDLACRSDSMCCSGLYCVASLCVECKPDDSVTLCTDDSECCDDLICEMDKCVSPIYTNDPTIDPTTDPTRDPTIDPTIDPTNDPTNNPTRDPTDSSEDSYDEDCCKCTPDNNQQKQKAASISSEKTPTIRQRTQPNTRSIVRSKTQSASGSSSSENGVLFEAAADVSNNVYDNGKESETVHLYLLQWEYSQKLMCFGIIIVSIILNCVCLFHYCIHKKRQNSQQRTDYNGNLP